MIFNKAKGGKTQTNKISCKKCLGLRLKMKYGCIKKLIIFFQNLQARIEFTLHYKSDVQKNILMHKMSRKKLAQENIKNNQT
jgi:hypothetical protein